MHEQRAPLLRERRDGDMTKDFDAQLDREGQLGKSRGVIMVFGAALVAVFAGVLAAAPAQQKLSGVYTIEQTSSKRLLDAYQSTNTDWTVVTRPPQTNATQHWILSNVAGSTYVLQQQSSGRYLDAYLTQEHDFTVVTRATQNNDTQRWNLTPLGNDTYRLQQTNTDRYLDAYQVKDRNFKAVTRPPQVSQSQVWRIKRVQ
jgi:hypothetical protein